MNYFQAKALVKLERRPFVYEIRWTDTGEVYVGSAGARSISEGGHGYARRLQRTAGKGNGEPGAREFSLTFYASAGAAREGEMSLIRRRIEEGVKLLNSKR